MTKYTYYGPTDKYVLAWTLEQMTGRLTTWEEFVRDNDPWLSEA